MVTVSEETYSLKQEVKKLSNLSPELVLFWLGWEQPVKKNREKQREKMQGMEYFKEDSFIFAYSLHNENGNGTKFFILYYDLERKTINFSVF